MVNYNAVIDVNSPDDDVTEPVDLSEAKEFCKIDISTDDNLLTSLITAARQQCEAYTGVSFVQRTFYSTLNNSNGGIYFPYGPVSEIFAVEDYDENEIEDYKLEGILFKRILSPKLDFIYVEYTGGYEVLPQSLITALLNQIYYLYDNRSQGVDDISPIAKMILNPYRRV